MKTPAQSRPSPAKKRAKARVMYMNAGGMPVRAWRCFDDDLPVAAIPLPSLKQARAVAAFFNLGEEERVIELARHLAAHFCKCEVHEVGGCEITAYSESARAVLALILKR